MSCGWMSGRLNETAPAAGLRVPGPVDRDPVHLGEGVEHVARQLHLVGADRVEAHAGEVVGGRADADRLGDRRRPRLELPRQLGPRGSGGGDVGDHLAAAQEGLHALQDVDPADEHADPGRAEHLVAGEGVEVGAERRHVDRHVRDGLGAVDQAEGAGVVRHPGDVGHRVDRAEHVARVGHRDHAHLLGQQRPERVHVQLAARRDRREDHLRPRDPGDDLPRDDVGVVLHLRHEHPVAGPQGADAPRPGHQVDRLAGVLGRGSRPRGGRPPAGRPRRGRPRSGRSPPRRARRRRGARWRSSRGSRPPSRRARPSASGTSPPSRGRRAARRGRTSRGSGSRP